MMNSFKMTAIGRVAKDLELKETATTCITRVTLIANDKYNGRETTNSVQFIAFGNTAKALVDHVRKGDQLFLEAHLKNNFWTDDNEQRHYDNDLIIDEFTFGAPGQIKRAELAARTNRPAEQTAATAEETAGTAEEAESDPAPKTNGSSRSSRRSRSKPADTGNDIPF